ncbi:hypothetical protein ACEWY4_012693 [Coilia grayii]|uniref:DUF7869 domain-containing protein n=1 Tax=Coilia grayii TaxID=363190 RepID=A0ABD1K1B8_9TELE
MSLSYLAGISKDRVTRVAKYSAINATSRPEQRGGARKVDEFEAKKQLVKEHIETFTCRASHYGRRGAPGRKYLPSDLSVKKMHKLFDQQNHDLVSYSLYYSVFHHSFNLAFGHPATDACSSCAKFHFRVKDPSLGEDEKRRETAMYILHRRRARVFYDMLGKVEHDAVTVCFDMMQNLVLPRTPIGQAYYSRQLYIYVFGVVLHHGKGSRQATDDVHLYTWMEHENTKGSNMTASALDHCLRHELKDALHSAQKLRLFSDCCFGQNKNMNILSMLFAFLKTEVPQITAEYAFPIRGHSFLLVDRVFGRIEQQVCKQETTLLPEEYHNIIRNHGRVHIYGQHWQAFDLKKEMQCFVKAQKSFKLSEARMLQFLNDKVGFKAVYNNAWREEQVLSSAVISQKGGRGHRGTQLGAMDAEEDDFLDRQLLDDDEVESMKPNTHTQPKPKINKTGPHVPVSDGDQAFLKE